jgi:hypothetical protein
MDRAKTLQRRIRILTGVFIAGLVISGLTAIPLEWELGVARKMLGGIIDRSAPSQSALAYWLARVQQGIVETNAKHPFIAYGTDWLAFAHFVIALAFVGAWRDPVRNIWLYQFGLSACLLVVPYALLFGGWRGIPLFWRLIDCSFGIAGLIPTLVCWRFTAELARLKPVPSQ